MKESLLDEVQKYFGDDCTEEQASLLEVLVDRAIASFKNKRNYPSNYSDEQISDDMERFHACLFDLVVYWFAKQGAEFQSSHIENTVHRVYMSENSIFASHMVVPFARFF